MDGFTIWHGLLILAAIYIVSRLQPGIIGRALYAAGFLVGRIRGGGGKQAHGQSAPGTHCPEYHPPADADYHQEVVGESHYQGAINAARKRYGDRCPASLLFEDDNPYDKQAVAILIDGQIVGRLSRDDARSYRKLFKKKGIDPANVTCHARIFGGGDKSYGVWLDVRT